MTDELREARKLLHRMTETKNAMCTTTGKTAAMIAEAQDTIKILLAEIERLQTQLDDPEHLIELVREYQLDLQAELSAEMYRDMGDYH